MDEPVNDNQDDTEFEMESPAVAVAPNPAMNGNGTAHQQPNQNGQVINKVITERYSVPANMNSLMGRYNNRPAYAAPKEKEKDDREFLDALNMKADAEDYELCFTRKLPTTNAEGDPVPIGAYSKHRIPIVNYDELQQQIIEVWGGGDYRVTVVDLAGHKIDNIQRCINIGIPTTQHPPKREKFEKIEIVRGAKNGATPIPVSEDEKLFKEEIEEERREDRRYSLEAKKTEREFKKIKREKEIEMMRRELLAPQKDDSKSVEIALLERRLEEEKRAREEIARKAEEDRKERDRRYDEDRKETQRRYEEDKKDALRREDETRRIMMESLTKLGESIKEVASRPVPLPPPDNSMEKLLAVMAPIATAFITKPQPDNKDFFIELNRAQAEGSKQVTALTTAMLAAPKTDPQAPVMGLIMKMMEKDSTGKDALLGNLLTAIVNNKGDTLTPAVMMELITMGEKRADKILEITQGMGGQHHPEGGEDAEYDPNMSFLGNAGKAIYGILKQLAATNIPEALSTLKQLIPAMTGRPTDAQLAQAAYQMERGSVPPALSPNAPPMLPGYDPINQQAIPYPPNPVYQQHQQAQQSIPQQRPMPPPLSPAPGQPQNPVAQQRAVASELEGGASGLPSNGDPEQQKVLTPEEEAEENLKEAVTNTVSIMIGESTGKPPKRTWPEDATDHWNAAFVQALVNYPNNNMRMQMIASKCDPEKIAQLTNILRPDPYEQDVLWREMRRFVDMNKPAQGPTSAPFAAPQPLPVQPAVQQTPQPAPVQG